MKYSELTLTEKYPCSFCVYHEDYERTDRCPRGEKKKFKNCGVTENGNRK